MDRKCKGAISVFLIIITLSCFMLGGVFIDAARILVAQHKVNLAMNSAARSAMSYYDENLVSEYGLYGVDKTEANENFKKYFNANLTKAKYDGVSLFKFTINDENTKMDADESFKSSMRRQIREYEKYRMPVTTTLAVINRFKDAFESFFDSKKAEKLNKAGDAADSLNDRIKDMGEVAKNSSEAIKDNIKSNLDSAIKDGVNEFLKSSAKNANTAIIDKSIEESMADAKSEINKMKEELEKLKESQKQFEDTSKEVEQPSQDSFVESGDADAKSKGQQAEIEYSKTEENIKKEIESLEAEIKTLEEGVNKIEGDLQKMSDELAILIAKWQSAESELEKAEAALEKVKNEKKIAQKEKALADYNSAINSADNAINEIYAMLQSEDVKNDYEDYKTALSEKNTTKQNEIVTKYKDDSNVSSLLSNYKTKYENEELKKQLQAQIDEANKEIKEEKDKVDACEKKVKDCKDAIKAKQKEMQDKVDELEDLTEPDIETQVIKDFEDSAKSAFNASKESLFGGIEDLMEEIKKEMPDRDNPDGDDLDEEKGLIKMFKQLMSEFEKLVSIVTNPERMVDEAMYIDYIMGKCTYLTNQNAKNHYFEWGEVEYILFGFDSQVANISATLASVYGIRFTINFINYLFTTPGGFISRIAGALGRALAQSLKDVTDMVFCDAGGEEAPGCAICPSLSNTPGKHLRLTYSDHLRLLLFIKFTEESDKYLDNTIHYTLIEEMNGKGTTDLYASATANVDVGVNLIMIPAFTDILPMDKYFRDGQFFIKQSTSYSY